jgi:hypothetical protein
MRVTHFSWLQFALFTLVFSVNISSYANRVIYYQSGNTTTLTSVPETNSGFSYSDGSGNSMSYSRTSAIPVIVNQFPNAIWVPLSNGYVPPNAIVLQYINGRQVFYCRVQQGGDIYYGQLVRNEGCYIPDLSEQAIQSYQTLVR